MDSSSPNSGCVLGSAELKRMVGGDALNVLKCGICWEFYVQPVVLACGHTFCYRCLRQMANHAKQNNSRLPIHISAVYIGCPNCRRPVFVSAILNQKVAQNYPIASLLESLRQQQRPEMVDKETNTDPPEPDMKESKYSNNNNEEIPHKTRTQHDFDEEQLDLITDDLDLMLRTLAANGTILGDMSCVADIQQIVRDFQNSSLSFSTDINDVANTANIIFDNLGGNTITANTVSRTSSTSSSPPQQIPPSGVHQFQQTAPNTALVTPNPATVRPTVPQNPNIKPSSSFEDPAILSFSMGSRGAPRSAHIQQHSPPPVPPQQPFTPFGLYGFPGFGQM